MATDLLEHDEAVVAVLRETMERAARIGACDPGLIPEILALIRAAQKKARETLDPTREDRYSPRPDLKVVEGGLGRRKGVHRRSEWGAQAGVAL